MNKLELKKRLVIGSANFLNEYGVEQIKINNPERKKIFNLLKKYNIYTLDTAESYLKNNNLFKNIDKKFQIITKIIPDEKWISLDYCYKKIFDHFKKFNGNKFSTLLFHNVDILFTNKGKKIFQNIESLKKNFFLKIGLSIYDVKCLNFLTTNYNIDVIQCPYNVLDKRLINSGWLKKLKKKGIEIHVRSIFLQGLLVNKSIYKTKYFNKWNKQISNWYKKLERINISPVDYCLTDLLRYDFDKIIVGINNSENLNEIINFKTLNKNKMINFKINDLNLIDPRNWK